PATLELPPEFSEVVDLPVEDDPDRSLGVGHRLMAAVEVDDREPAEAESERSFDVVALVVWPPVHEGLGHLLHLPRLYRTPAREFELPANPAHADQLPLVSSMKLRLLNICA